MIVRLFGKLMWVGRATSAVVGLLVLFLVAIGAANSALAHAGVDTKLFHLGHNNPVVAISTLAGTLTGAVLKVDNNGTGPALSLEAGTGKAPIAVNGAAGTATGLSADELDGRDSAAYQRRVGGSCAEGSSIRVIDAAGRATCEPDDDGTVQANALRRELGTDDMRTNETSDPVSFSKVKDVPLDVLSRNADRFDGKDSSEFAATAHAHSGADITNGTVSEARIDGAIARDGEVMNTVKATDGAGSGLDADKLDGKEPSQLPGSIGQVGWFKGYPGVNFPVTTSWNFMGGVTQVTTNPAQRLVGVGQAPLSDGGNGTIHHSFAYDLCYQPSGGGPIVNFTGGFHSIGSVGPYDQSWTAAATTVPGAGTWNVGFCVKTHSAFDIDDTNYVNGWVQVLNQ